MSEKELLYIEDSLSHLENLHDYVNDSIDCLEKEEYSKVLQELLDLNESTYKKFYKLLG
jgi:hypothetical protein